MDVQRKSVTLCETNIEYINRLCQCLKIDSFSRVLDQIVSERRMNEEFDSCQNKF